MKSVGLHGRVTVCLLMSVVANQGVGALTDLMTAPITKNSSLAPVLPNIMFTLDASGSMAWDFLPDNVGNAQGSTARNCRGWSSNKETRVSCSSGDASSQREAPYYAYQYNKIYYNPQVTYSPGVDPDPVLVGGAVSRGPQTNLAAVKVNSYSGNSTIDLATRYPEVVYCQASSDDPNVAANYPNRCRQNTNGYLYPDGTYDTALIKNSAPFYYTITPKEYCDSANLVNCVISASPTGSYTVPAPVRHCQTNNLALSSNAVSGNTSGKPSCQAKYDKSTHTYVRYGTFSRTDIVPTTATYSGRPNRTDCAGNNVSPPATPSGICTYAEEAINFANWYAYYRTRMQMMKTVAGQAFIPMDQKFRIGLITINPMSGGSVSSSKYLPVDVFNITQKTAWYNKFYSQNPSGGTPLREALSRVGRYYGGITSGINSGMTPDPVQYSCQRNFAILTTDGYWNGGAGVDLSGNYIGNMDNVHDAYTNANLGSYDTNAVPTNDNNSLADVAAYYYRTDLRPTGSTGALGTPVSKDNVKTSGRDANKAQHMLTYTIGLADGKMTYVSNYRTDTFGDFYKIATGLTGCSWQSSGVCNWPMPVADTDTAIDDLWHAGINGYGEYFSANDPVTLASGLKEALKAIDNDTGAAAAAATSSPNITQSDNGIFSTVFNTPGWDGEVKKQAIITSNGTVDDSATPAWTAAALLDARVATGSSNPRVVYTFSSSSGNKLKPFEWSQLSAAERAYFSNKGNQLHQYGSLTTTGRADADNGQLLVEYLSGQRGHELSAVGGVFRTRVHVLGDTVSSTPVYVKAPRFNFTDTGYAAFKAAQTSTRKAMLYIAANDGMLHAFDATNGQEEWAFVPRSIFPKLYKLATDDYATNHQFFVDGSPEVMDIKIGTDWKTILVGGMNAGGRAYYALDITDPAQPVALWEFCTDASLCSVQDDDLGYSFGNPIITKDATGRWVVMVASGYNNVSPGDGGGRLYVLDAANGSKLRELTAGAANTSTPSGLAKIAAWADDGDVDNTATYVYGADLNGDVWRFDLTATAGSPNPLLLATLTDASSNRQPVTTKPELGLCNYKHMVYIGTGRLLGNSDVSNNAQQTVYGFKDDLGATGLGNLHASSQMVRQTISAGATATTRTITNNPVNLSTGLGWYADLLSSGERVNVDPQLVLGTLLVAGNIPDTSGGTDACEVDGAAWQYQFDYCTGSFVTTSTDQIVANSLDATTAGFVVISLPDGTIKQIVTDSTGKKITLGVNIGGTSGPGKRVGWREILN